MKYLRKYEAKISDLTEEYVSEDIEKACIEVLESEGFVSHDILISYIKEKENNLKDLVKDYNLDLDEYNYEICALFGVPLDVRSFKNYSESKIKSNNVFIFLKKLPSSSDSVSGRFEISLIFGNFLKSLEHLVNYKLSENFEHIRYEYRSYRNGFPIHLEKSVDCNYYVIYKNMIHIQSGSGMSQKYTDDISTKIRLKVEELGYFIGRSYDFDKIDIRFYKFKK